MLEQVATPAALEGLYTVSGGGFDVACDAFCRDPETEAVWFLSMVGSQVAVKAVTGCLLKQPPAPVHLAQGLVDDGLVGEYMPCSVPRETFGSWTIKLGKLAAGRGWHSFVYPKWAELAHTEPNFLVLARTPDEAPAIHYRFLDNRSKLPLHPSWRDWLWRRGLENGEIKELESLGVTGYRCVPNPLRLEDEISEAVAEGRLTVPGVRGRSEATCV